MALTFYCGSGSPFAWRVWLALEHKGVPYELKMLSFDRDEHKSPEMTALNPRQKVPVIVDDGFALYESSAILEYIEDKWPVPHLLSGDLQQRAVQRRLVREADQYIGKLEGELGEALFGPAEKRSAEKAAAALAAFRTEVRRWEDAVQGTYLTGDSLSLADITLYPYMALMRRMAKRLPETGEGDIAGPKLSAWIDRMEALPLVQKTWPPHWK